MGDAQFATDPVAGDEPKPSDVLGQSIGVALDRSPGLLAELAVDPPSLIRGEAGDSLQVDHQVVDALVLGPALANGLRPHGPDARHLLEARPALLQLVESILAEMSHESLGVERAEALDAGPGQVPLDRC